MGKSSAKLVSANFLCIITISLEKDLICGLAKQQREESLPPKRKQQDNKNKTHSSERAKYIHQCLQHLVYSNSSDMEAETVTVYSKTCIKDDQESANVGLSNQRRNSSNKSHSQAANFLFVKINKFKLTNSS